jgi:LysR family carnitine catabolism transcriptional activator
MINLRHLRAFTAVAEELHFTKAAEVVCVSQPALSGLIKQLEDWTEVQLIHRNTRQVELTQAGTEFYGTVRQILRDLDHASNELKLYKSIKRGKVSIGALPSLCSSIFPQVLRVFRQAYPNIRIDIEDLSGAHLKVPLLNREIHLACTYSQYGSDIEGTPFQKDSLVVLCSKDSEVAKMRSITWQELTKHPIVAMAKGTTVRTLIDGVVAARDLHLDVVSEPQLMATASAFASAGIGIAILPTAGIPSCLSPDLVALELTEPKIERELSVLTLEGHELSPAAAKLKECILENSADFSF